MSLGSPLSTRMKSSDIQKELEVETLLRHVEKGPVEVTGTSDQDVARFFPVEVLHIRSGLRSPLDPTGTRGMM